MARDEVRDVVLLLACVLARALEVAGERADAVQASAVAIAYAERLGPEYLKPTLENHADLLRRLDREEEAVAYESRAATLEETASLRAEGN